MSLINQVLKDLDRQRGPADGSHVAALQGVGLVPDQASSAWPRIGLAFGLLILLSLLGISAFEYLNRPTTATQEPVRPATVSDANVGFPDSKDPASKQAAPAPNPEPAPATGTGTPGHEKTPVAPAQATSSHAETVLNTAETSASAETETALEIPSASAPVKRMSPSQRAEQHYLKALKAIDREDTALAEKLLTESLGEYARHTDARIQLAGLLISQHRETDAESLIKEGLELAPGEMALRRLYAQLLATRADFSTALAVLQPTEATGINDAETFGLRAAIQARLKDFERSADDYRHALTLDPKRADWWTGLGIALEHLGRADVAVTAYRRALDLPLQEGLRTFSEQRLQLLQQAFMERDG